MSNEWYTDPSGQENSWYEQAPPRAAAAAVQARRGNAKGWLIVLLSSLFLIALIAATAVVFGSRGSKSDTPALPDIGEWGDKPGVFDDFRDFFENYYTAFEERADCLIPRVSGYPNVELTLMPADEFPLTLQQVYEKCAPSVVAVTAYIEEDNDDRYYWGTGIILTQDGYIVTNSHVVEGSCRAKVTLWNDEEYDVLLVGNDSRSDIAVLKINARGLTAAEFCDTTAMCVGDQVVAIGNPLGNEFRSTMTEGIISGIDRDISYNGTTLTLLQTSAPINEGNSGGPLINMSGQVIGITNMKMSNSTGAVTIEGVGFAIPSQTVKTMADSILAHGEVLGRPALGLTLGAIPDEARKQYEYLPEGLYVSGVAEGSDCREKGVLVGDVITAVNGRNVSTTADVTDIIAQCSVGDTMVLTIWRMGKGDAVQVFELLVTLVDVNDVY